MHLSVILFLTCCLLRKHSWRLQMLRRLLVIVQILLKFLQCFWCTLAYTYTFPATWRHFPPLTGTKLCCLVTEAHVYEQLAQGCYLKVERPGLKLTTFCIASPASQPLHHQATKHADKTTLCVLWVLVYNCITGIIRSLHWLHQSQMLQRHCVSITKKLRLLLFR